MKYPKLKLLRKQRRFSLQQVEDNSGISKRKLSECENGIGTLTDGELMKLASLYGVTVEELRGNDA
jgi:transcriptional regulator with XRE-family HTH domain